MIVPAPADDNHIMRVLRACLFLLVAATLHPALHASTRATTRRLTPTTVASHRTEATLLHHLSFPRHYPPAMELPTEPAPSSINPVSSTHSFSLISFAIHSFLGFFGHTAA